LSSVIVFSCSIAEVSRAFARFVDHLLRLRVRLRQNFSVTLFRFGELLLDLLGVQLRFGDPLATLFEHGQDRLVSETLQDQRHDDEADDLRQEQLWFPSKLLSGLTCLIENTRG